MGVLVVSALVGGGVGVGRRWKGLFGSGAVNPPAHACTSALIDCVFWLRNVASVRGSGCIMHAVKMCSPERVMCALSHLGARTLIADHN